MSMGNYPMGFHIQSDGSGADRLIVPAGGFRTPVSERTSILEWDEDHNGRTKMICIWMVWLYLILQLLMSIKT